MPFIYLFIIIIIWIHGSYCLIRVRLYSEKIYLFSVHFILNEFSSSHFKDPVPSSLPLQGGKGFSRSSSELSSSESVWLPRKWKENERKGEKMEKAGEAESLCAKTLLID